jgi:transposase
MRPLHELPFFEFTPQDHVAARNAIDVRVVKGHLRLFLHVGPQQLTVELRRRGADHRYIPLLVTVPGVGWVIAFTIASEIGDINRFPTPTKLCGYTGLCPRVIQSGTTDRRGPISKHGPKYLRWALFEVALHACTHPLYRDRYQRTKQRLGRQRGPKVAQIDLSRKITEAIWHMLTRNQPFAPAGAPFV